MSLIDQLFALALAASHSAFVICFTPSPLQAFLPAQSCFAVLHSLVPLHAFTLHFRFVGSIRGRQGRGRERDRSSRRERQAGNSLHRACLVVGHLCHSSLILSVERRS
jgi:hypothetical protein